MTEPPKVERRVLDNYLAAWGDADPDEVRKTGAWKALQGPGRPRLVIERDLPTEPVCGHSCLIHPAPVPEEPEWEKMAKELLIHNGTHWHESCCCGPAAAMLRDLGKRLEGK